jgi:hypothetical protein
MENQKTEWKKLIVEYSEVDITAELQSFGDYFGELDYFGENRAVNKSNEDLNLLKFMNDLVERMYYYHIFARPNVGLYRMDPLRFVPLRLMNGIILGYVYDILGHDVAQHLMSGVMLTEEADGPNSYFNQLYNLRDKLNMIEYRYSTKTIERYFEKLSDGNELTMRLYKDKENKSYFAPEDLYILGGTLGFQKTEHVVTIEGNLDNLLKFLKLSKSANKSDSDFFSGINRLT